MDGLDNLSLQQKLKYLMESTPVGVCHPKSKKYTQLSHSIPGVSLNVSQVWHNTKIEFYDK